YLCYHVMSVFSIITPPTRPTLFPYTTLFRSHPRRSALRGGAGLRAAPRQGGDAHRGAPAQPEGGGQAAAVGALRSPWLNRFNRPDRKSTRLNSSHVKISYAVFCLKKKIRDGH